MQHFMWEKKNFQLDPLYLDSFLEKEFFDQFLYTKKICKQFGLALVMTPTKKNKFCVVFAIGIWDILNNEIKMRSYFLCSLS